MSELDLFHMTLRGTTRKIGQNLLCTGWGGKISEEIREQSKLSKDGPGLFGML